MASDGDIIRIQIVSSLLGKELRNVFYYEMMNSTLPIVPLLDILDEYDALVVANLAPNSSSAMSGVRIEADNLTDGLEFAQVNSTWVGALGGDALPRFNAVSVQLRRQTKVTRNGSKRFAGLSEARVGGNTVNLGDGVRERYEALCAPILTFPDWNGAGASVQLQQVIIGRTLNASGNYEPDLTKINHVVDVIVSNQVTTQNTRKD